MRMVKCPECGGAGKYEIEQGFQGEVLITPITCPECGGTKQISWAHFCSKFRKPKSLSEKIKAAHQEWFWTPEWQEKERRADEDIKAGRLSEPFDNADDVIAYLHSFIKPE